MLARKVNLQRNFACFTKFFCVELTSCKVSSQCMNLKRLPGNNSWFFVPDLSSHGKVFESNLSFLEFSFVFVFSGRKIQCFCLFLMSFCSIVGSEPKNPAIMEWIYFIKIEALSQENSVGSWRSEQKPASEQSSSTQKAVECKPMR